jgi:hypothetical protein
MVQVYNSSSKTMDKSPVMVFVGALTGLEAAPVNVGLGACTVMVVTSTPAVDPAMDPAEPVVGIDTPVVDPVASKGIVVSLAVIVSL